MGDSEVVRKALDHAFVGHLLQLWTVRSGRDKYQFRSVKQVMVPPRAQGSVDDVRLFKGISLNDNCIPGCSSPERSMLDEIGLLFENVLEHSTLPGPHPTTHEEEDRTSVAMSHWYHDIRAL